jgi:anti-sigma B factor antagonist
MQPRDKFFSALLGIQSAAAMITSSETVEVVSAGDRLNADGMDALRTKLTACAQRGSWRYVVDLTRVKTIDSPGLGMLVSALRSIADLGGAVGLVTNSPRLQRLLELCARSRSCKIFERTGDALFALRKAQPKTAA